jgi:hypothetical protein
MATAAVCLSDWIAEVLRGGRGGLALCGGSWYNAVRVSVDVGSRSDG